MRCPHCVPRRVSSSFLSRRLGSCAVTGAASRRPRHRAARRRRHTAGRRSRPERLPSEHLASERRRFGCSLGRAAFACRTAVEHALGVPGLRQSRSAGGGRRRATDCGPHVQRESGGVRRAGGRGARARGEPHSRRGNTFSIHLGAQVMFKRSATMSFRTSACTRPVGCLPCCLTLLFPAPLLRVR